MRETILGQNRRNCVVLILLAVLKSILPDMHKCSNMTWLFIKHSLVCIHTVEGNIIQG